MLQEVPPCLEKEIWQSPAPSRGLPPCICTFLHASTSFDTPPTSWRSHVALRWSAAWWWAPPRVLTLRSFPPCGLRLLIPGLFSTERGLSFSGLDPSFVSSDTEGPPPPPNSFTRLLLTWGVGASAPSSMRVTTVFNDCDTPDSWCNFQQNACLISRCV